ncbi:hypothetical protein PI125_g18821 [Phytophthora idaei]|nr:hypothetical protein PI125_g18821 [Phytophthora idaei]
MRSDCQDHFPATVWYIDRPDSTQRPTASPQARPFASCVADPSSYQTVEICEDIVAGSFFGFCSNLATGSPSDRRPFGCRCQ